MRLRIAPIEYKVCASQDCSIEYEGSQCPQCRGSFNPERVKKVTHDRLILVDADPPVYEREQRCRCTECGNLYHLSDSGVVANAKCGRCGKPLFSQEQLRRQWRGTETLLQRARRLDRARKEVALCPHCKEKVDQVCWCPLCHSGPSPYSSSCFPQNPTVVWIRTFNFAESLEELQDREWLEQKEDDLQVEVEIQQETEEEVNHDNQ